MSLEDKKCPACGYVRKADEVAPDFECPSCGKIYSKIKNQKSEPTPEETIVLSSTASPIETTETKQIRKKLKRIARKEKNAGKPKIFSTILKLIIIIGVLIWLFKPSVIEKLIDQYYVEVQPVRNQSNQ